MKGSNNSGKKPYNKWNNFGKGPPSYQKSGNAPQGPNINLSSLKPLNSLNAYYFDAIMKLKKDADLKNLRN